MSFVLAWMKIILSSVLLFRLQVATSVILYETKQAPIPFCFTRACCLTKNSHSKLLKLRHTSSKILPGWHCRGCCLGDWSSEDTLTRSELGKLSRNGELVFSVWVQFLCKVIKPIHHFFVSVLCHTNVFRVEKKTGRVKISVQHGPPVDERLMQLMTLRTGDAVTWQGSWSFLEFRTCGISFQSRVVRYRPLSVIRISYTGLLTSMYNWH